MSNPMAVTRQVALRFRENLTDGLARRWTERSKGGALIFAGEYFPEPRIKMLLHRHRQSVERVRVNQIAARVLEQARLQIEIAQRPAPLARGPRDVKSFTNSALPRTVSV